MVNALVWLRRTCLLLALILVSGVVGMGCVSKSKIDWNSRVGKYTYDQAVIDMGPPDKSATLSDGVLVAQWLTHRGYSSRTFLFSSGWINSMDAPPTPDQFLTLTFAPDKRLKEWKWIYK